MRRSAKIPSRNSRHRLRPGERFRDFDAAPEMIVVPAGSLPMKWPRELQDAEEEFGPQGSATYPQHRVTTENAFAVSVAPVTRCEFAARSLPQPTMK